MMYSHTNVHIYITFISSTKILIGYPSHNSLLTIGPPLPISDSNVGCTRYAELTPTNLTSVSLPCANSTTTSSREGEAPDSWTPADPTSAMTHRRVPLPATPSAITKAATWEAWAAGVDGDPVN